MMENSNTNNFINLGRKVSLITLVSCALLLPACANYENPKGSVEGADSVENVVEDVDQYVGKTVTIQGEVGDQVGSNSFILEDVDLLGQEEKLLVINPTSASPVPVTEDQRVQITGEVREFVTADFERDYGLTWDAQSREQIEAEYESRPVLVVQSMQIVEAR